MNKYIEQFVVHKKTAEEGKIESWGWGDEDIEPLNFRQLESLWPADTSVSIFNEAKYSACKKWNQQPFIFEYTLGRLTWNLNYIV